MVLDKPNTGDPRYSWGWYSRFCLIAVEELIPKLVIRGTFSCLFVVFGRILADIKHTLAPKCKYSGPSLFAVLVFAGYFWDYLYPPPGPKAA